MIESKIYVQISNFIETIIRIKIHAHALRLYLK